LPNLFKRAASWSWVPDADAVGAPDGALLRATNTIPDAAGARVLRRGSRNLHTGIGTNVRSLLSPILQDQKYRFAGTADSVYGGPANGSLTLLGANFKGSGDIAMGEDAYQAFFARGSTKKKYDGTTFNNWGIAAPTSKPGVSAVNAITSNVATFNGASHGTPDSPAFVINEGAGAEVDGYASGGADSFGALQLTPSASPGPGAVASCTKKFTSDQDFLDIGGAYGGDTDLFDMRVAMDNPKKVEKVRVMFGLNTGNDPFADDYYYFDFNIKQQKEVDLKDPETNAVAAYNAATDKLLSTLTASEITDVRSPEAAGDIVKKLTSLRGDKSQSRTDSIGASPAWGHFTVTRGQFKRVGKTSGRDWSTVRGFKIVYNVISGNTTATIRFDDANWIGGGTRSLSGTFQVGYRFARQFTDVNGNEIYTELSPMSPVSDKINLAQQSLQINIPEAAITAKDTQVNAIWVYLYGGWLDTYYRVAIISATPSTGMTIDDLANPDGLDFEDGVERVRLTSHGFTFVQTHTPITTATSPAISSITNGGSGTTVTVTFSGAHGWLTGDFVQIMGIPESGYEGIYPITKTGANTFTYTAISTPSGAPATITNASVTYMNALIGTPTGSSTNDINLTLFKGELDALIENEPFEAGSAAPPSNIIGIAGPWRKRLFALTKEGWLYVSSAKHPSSFSVYHAIDLRQYGTPYWVIEAGEHIYAGCSKDVIRIAGSGEIDSTGVLLDLYPQEMSIANPPADDSAATDGNSIIYRSGDGPMMLMGASLKPVPFAGTSFLWKGRERHTIEPLNTDTGRFRFEVDNHNLYMLAPEGTEDVNAVQYFDQTLGTVTAYYEEAHGYQTGDEVLFSSSARSDHNAKHYVTVVNTTTLTFTIDTERTETVGSAVVGNIAGYSQRCTQPNSVWKFMPSHQQWCRFDYPAQQLSIWREYNGQLIVGTNDGRIREIEYGLDDDGSGILVDVLTPFDDGGNPTAGKNAADVQVHGKTGGTPGSLVFYKDGNVSAPVETISYSISDDDVYRSAFSTLDRFLRLQVNIAGTFTEFGVTHLGVSYRPRPQQFMVLDSGHVVPNAGQNLAWVSHVYLDCYSPVDLQLQIYKNGSLYDTCDIPVTANERDEYTVVMPRGTKGRRLQFKVITTNSAGQGDVGFEPYSLSVKNALSGKVTELPFNAGDKGNN
jgi:hypothetical protein